MSHRLSLNAFTRPPVLTGGALGPRCSWRRGLCAKAAAKAAKAAQIKTLSRVSEIPTERVRNFSIISHVDHGKSTLADRMLEITGAVVPGEALECSLDSLEVERSRGVHRCATRTTGHSKLSWTPAFSSQGSPSRRRR